MFEQHDRKNDESISQQLINIDNNAIYALIVSGEKGIFSTCHSLFVLNTHNIQKNVISYVFRHSQATTALESGDDLHLVSQSLDHAGFNTTSRYLHIRPNQCSSAGWWK